jgi:hypothetical protein
MSDRIQIHSRVGKDGVLQVRVPLKPADAGKDMLVTITPAHDSPKNGMNWQQFLDSTYGSCAELGLQRPDQGAFEQPRQSNELDARFEARHAARR